jgi:hypothetical protein
LTVSARAENETPTIDNKQKSDNAVFCTVNLITLYLVAGQTLHTPGGSGLDYREKW